VTEPRCRAFARAAEGALADRDLQAALARTTGRFLAARAAAVAAFPGFEEAREQASRIKEEALARLDVLIERFVEAAWARGASVHAARDGAEACAVAARIARDEGVAEAVKSKSMLAEEIGLAGALERAGIAVTESDLGEFIVQLAGEPPSHIIAPAVHKTREEVFRLFRKRLGAPETPEIPALVGAAREHLRAKFLAAGMGITGANFLCADTGSAVVVTNEGNARMGTILPRVHLVVAGIEKIIPSLADLPLFLRLLTRSATGQVLSSYVSILTGTRRPGDAEGPDRLHVILVDNGRSAILEGKYREILKCIRCGACLNACPVYQAVGGHAYGWIYQGPVGAVLSPLLLGLAEASPLPEASTLCGACAEVCPVKIPLPEMLLALRDDARRRGIKTPAEVLAIKAFAALMSRAGILEAVERIAGALSGLLWPAGRIGWLPPPLSRWTANRDFPAPAPRPFRTLWKHERGAQP